MPTNPNDVFIYAIVTENVAGIGSYGIQHDFMLMHRKYGEFNDPLKKGFCCFACSLCNDSMHPEPINISPPAIIRSS
ncbi:MAG: hypothetical protein JWP88_934 [Flaviaesturariibacter sp.]|nr:hypothetical protein [Flaviaesturariibacter sp.]